MFKAEWTDKPVKFEAHCGEVCTGGTFFGPLAQDTTAGCVNRRMLEPFPWAYGPPVFLLQAGKGNSLIISLNN